MSCKLCKEFYEKFPLQKNIDGRVGHKLENYSMSAIQCAFKNHDKLFSEENWNCQTVNLIRDICYEGRELPREVQYRYCEDMKYATINIYDILEVEGMALWVSWYKQRGRTDALWILDSLHNPRKPTEKELIAIINYYSKKMKKE